MIQVQIFMDKVIFSSFINVKFSLVLWLPSSLFESTITLMAFLWIPVGLNIIGNIWDDELNVQKSTKHGATALLLHYTNHS